VFAGMLIAMPALGIWPPREQQGVDVHVSSPYAKGVKVEILGAPVAVREQMTSTVDSQATVTVVTATFQTVTTTVRITNDVLQPAAIQGTPTPGAPTPAPEPAKILGVGVKVLFYDLPRSDPNKKIVGSGVGNYYSATGLEPGGSAEVVVVATDVGDYNTDSGYEAFADGLWTDKDPIKTPEPLSNGGQTGEAQALQNSSSRTP
jgi:hypothetical protein